MTLIKKSDGQGAANDLDKKNVADREQRMTLIKKRDREGAPNNLDQKT